MDDLLARTLSQKTTVTDVLDISVVIPTYNRLATLRETLRALANQTLPEDRFEVILVDDGSTDGTGECVSALDLPYRLGLLYQRNRGASAARNLGASQAVGEVILFLDADMIAHPDLLSQHLGSHQVHGKALVAGLRETHEGTPVDPVVRLLEEGLEVNHPRRRGGSLTFQEAFTCNLSLRAMCWQMLGGFDEEFPASGYEDIEFAYRATFAGFEVVRNPKAIAYHNHPMTLPQYCRQARSYQRSAALLFKRHPELCGQIVHLRDKEPVSWRGDSVGLIVRKLVRQLLASGPVLKTMEVVADFVRRKWASPQLLRFLYWKIVGSYQLIGLREGMKQYGC